MSFGTIAAVVGTVSAGVGIVGALDAKKQADKQYEAQEAAFADEVQAAITNAEWKLGDNESQYVIDNRQAQANYQSYVDATWDTFNANADYTRANAMLENTVTREMTDIELASIKENTRIELSALADLATLEAEHKLISATIHNDELMTKAAIDSAEYANLANNALQFIDQDINTIKTQMNSLKEISDVQTKEAIGQEIMRTADSVNAGGSSARKLMNTYIKSDIMLNTKLEEQESAIDKAFATQTRTAKDTAARISSTISRANNAIASNSKQAINTVQQNIASTKIDMQTKMDSLLNASATLRANANTTMNAMAKKSNIQVTQLADTLARDVIKATTEYNTDVQFRQDTLNDSQYRTARGLEQSIITQRDTKDRVEADRNLLDFYNNNPLYIGQATARGELQIEADISNNSLSASLLGYTDMQSFWNDYSTNGSWDAVNENLVLQDLNRLT